MMRRYWPVLIILGAALLLVGAARADQALQFTSIDFPAATLTNVQGINAEGDIVGFYQDAAGQHGFVRRNGVFTSINYPGAISTDARGISADGDIVGSYTVAPGGPPNIHGYLLRQGTLTEIQFPGHMGTIAQRISSHGDIYGCYHDTDLMGTMHGFVRDADGNFAEHSQERLWTGLDVPASMNNGAVPSGNIIVGLYTDMMTDQTHGYVLDFGNFMPFDFPDSVNTSAWDISPEGQIVGAFQDTNTKFHGFVRTREGDFMAIDFPGSSATRAFGINPRAEIVGAYVDSNPNPKNRKTHGYLLSKVRHDED